MTLGIVAAMHEEIAELLRDMEPGARIARIGMRDYYVGTLDGHACVIVLARLGKVAAAATATALIHEFKTDRLLFTGLAGGIAPGLPVGDVVVASALMQHDLDAQPLFPRHEVPLLGKSRFDADPQLSAQLVEAAGAFLREQLPQRIDAATLRHFRIDAPRVHAGLVLSGDQFISSHARAAALLAAAPDALAVEMEGAAVAQVCYEYGVRFAVMRTVSDNANDQAHVDFPPFLKNIASVYSHGIVKRFLALDR
ncbi:MAG: 5'-methylthioadenosine/adenosylhomocysteine nucleosidase [Burkholderiales bacterium]|nr:5'-methylthioadenosine/adenosylhomocysteine nucleosidase [Burkholderiales bacterium]